MPLGMARRVPVWKQAAWDWAGRGPAVHSLAAVGVEDSAEEFHAHDGKGVVEDEQREAQAGEEGQRDRVTRGQAGEPASSGSPASSDPRS